MTIPRVVGLLIVLAAIGVAAVGIRSTQARHTLRVQELQFRQARLRQDIWAQEMELARLRSLELVRQRASRLGLAAGDGDARR